MSGLKALGTICASLLTAFVGCALAASLPDDPYQRWQLSEGTDVDHLRWGYERIHFDSRPIDVVVVGPSKGMFGVSAPLIEQRLAERGMRAHVVNLAVPGEGRNLHWAVLEEVFKAKEPKVVVVAVSEPRAEYGHAGFKLIAPAVDIALTPEPLLHNYFPDLASLPARQTKLFLARFFPALFELRDKFDPALYAATKWDFTTGRFVVDGITIDMEAEVPAEKLAAQLKGFKPFATTLSHLLIECCNEGDDRVYLKKIMDLADRHGARLIFDYLPNYDLRPALSDRDFLAAHGEIVDSSDLSSNPKMFYNSAHLNRAGAIINSGRIADKIADMKISGLQG